MQRRRRDECPLMHAASRTTGPWLRTGASPAVPVARHPGAVSAGCGQVGGEFLWLMSPPVPPAFPRGRRRGHAKADLMSDQAAM